VDPDPLVPRRTEPAEGGNDDCYGVAMASLRIRRSLVLLLILCMAPRSRTFHLAADGDDARTETLAQAAATPWKSLGRLEAVALQPGDSILLKRGDTWRQPLVLRRSGTAGRPIVVSGYGDGTALPTLDGTVRLTGRSEGGRFVARVPGGVAVAAVFTAGGRFLPVSRHPESGYLQAASTENGITVVAPQVSGMSWTGGSIHLRTAMWTLETHRLAVQDAGRLTMAEKSIYPPPDSVRFFLSNHVSAFGARPAWAWSEADSTLRWTGPDSVVDAAVVPTLLDLSGQDHVHVAGVRFFGSARQALKASGTGIRVLGCEFQDPGLFGLDASGREMVARDNRFEGATNSALVGDGSASVIEGNVIRQTAVPSRLGPAGMGDGCCGGYGILVHGDSIVLGGNRIDSTGYNGLGFFGQANVVEGNDIAHSCMTTDDCAGIYTITGEYAKPGARGSVVRRNFVRDAVGAPEGWRGAWPASQGIYLDDGSHDMTVDSNVVSNAVNGLFLHNSQRILARGNVLFANRSSPILMTHDQLAGAGDMVDNRLVGNLMVGLQGQGSGVSSQISQIQSVRPYVSEGNVACHDQGLSAGCRMDGTVLWSRERVAVGDARLGPEIQKNASFDTTIWGWDPYPTQVRLEQDSGARCAKGKCLRVSSAGPALDIYPMVYCGFAFATSKGQALRLTFLARGREPGQNLTTTLRRSGGDWSILGFSSDVNLDTTWTRHDIVLRSPSDEPAVRVEFHNSMIDSVYWLDEVSVRTVPDSLLADGPLPLLLSNPSAEARIASLPAGASWMDPWSRPVPASISLAAYEGRVVFPYQGGGAGTGTRRPARVPLAIREGLAWRIEGLDGPAFLVGADGRAVGRVVPGARGDARWVAPRKGVYWLRSAAGAVPIVVAD